MKKKKLLLSLTLAAASFIALASCGSKNDDKSSKVSTQETSGDNETTGSNASVPAGSTGAEETTGTNQNVSKVVVNLHANPSDISEVTGTVEVNLLSKDGSLRSKSAEPEQADIRLAGALHGSSQDTSADRSDRPRDSDPGRALSFWM